MPSMELKSISGKGIKSLVLFQKPSLYAVISLTNVNQPTTKKSKKKTSVDRSNGENPVWDQPIRIDIDSSHKQDLILQFDLKAEAILGDRVVGRAFIPVADLDFSGAVQHVSYQLKTPEGKANGAINLSYKVDGPAAAVSPPIAPFPTLGMDYSPAASFAPSAPPVSAYPPQPEAASGYYPTVDPVVAYPPPGTAAAGTYPPLSSAGYYPKMEPGVSYPPLPPDGGYPPQLECCCREIPQLAPNVCGYYPPPAYPPQPECLPQPAPNVGGYYPPPAYPPQSDGCCPEIPRSVYPPQPEYYQSAQHPAPGSYYPPQPEYYPSAQHPAPGSYYPPQQPPDVYGHRQQGWDRGMYGYN